MTKIKKELAPANCPWVIATVKEPVLWDVSQSETWMLNPPHRYVLSSEQLKDLDTRLDSWSDLKNGANYSPLRGSDSLEHKYLLVIRHLERGIGDLLFMTGPLSYLYDASGGTLKTYYYTLADKVPALMHNPHLYYETPMVGPVDYDAMKRYDRHWLVESATEYDAEPDQMNVYDALFKQLGIDPASVDAKYKKPIIRRKPEENRNLGNFFSVVKAQRGLDLRTEPYYVVAPLASSTLRSLNYQVWIELIKELSKFRAVVVMGHVGNSLIPAAGLEFDEFYASVADLSTTRSNVVNLLGSTPLRLTMSIISAAKGVVTLDSGLLYVAQGLGTPCVSIWGTHDPSVRIGYDELYMSLALWKKEACPFSPCFAHDRFPVHKCPQRDAQKICNPMVAVEASDIFGKIQEIEQRFPFAECSVAAAKTS